MKKILYLFVLLLVLSSCSFSSALEYKSINNPVPLRLKESQCTTTKNILYASCISNETSVININETTVAIPDIKNESLLSELKTELEKYIDSVDLPFKPNTIDYFFNEAFNTRTYTFFVSDSIESAKNYRYYFSYDIESFEKKNIYDFITSKKFEELMQKNYNKKDITVDGIEVLFDGINVHSNGQAYFISSSDFQIEKYFSVFYPDNYTPVKDKSEKYIALTFDDGPNPQTTSKLLKILNDNDVKATFFMVGYNIEEYPWIVREVFSGGHDIGLHSYGHTNYSLTTFDKVIEDLDKCGELIYDIVGKRPYLVRPPFGSIKTEDIDTDSYFFVNWNVDPCDWQASSAEQIANHIIDMARTGSIVLMHDLYNISCDATDVVIKKLKDEGYRFVTISEYFDLNGKKSDNKLHFWLEDFNG